MDTRRPTEEFLRSIDIHELLPQQEPFVMVGEVVGYNDTDIVTETFIREDNLFVENGVFTAPGLVENIAQTCAARIGYVNKYILLKGIQIGVIGSVRNLSIKKCPRAGERIRTSVKVDNEIFGMTLASAEITCGDELLVTTQIKIAIRDGAED